VKYWPVIWAGIWRKPGEALLTCLAVSAAFTLFGLMVGLDASYRRITASYRNDRLEVDPRFPLATGIRFPLSMRGQIERLRGVSAVGAYYLLRGYYQDPHNSERIFAVDENMQRASPELPISSGQWALLRSTPNGVLVSRKTALKWHLKPGDAFPLTTDPSLRTDGAPYWSFQVLAIVPDDPTRVNGFILGNFKYVEESVPAQDRGVPMGFRVAIADPARADQTSLTIDRLFANSGNPTITIPDKTNWENAFHSGTAPAPVALPIAGAGLFMILLLVANGIAQSVRIRVPEFAVLHAAGFQVGSLAAFVFAEAVTSCLVGALLGTASAAFLTEWPWRYLPLDLTSRIPAPTLSSAVLGWALLAASLVALASSAAPILRLRRVSVSDALAGR
jgi:putative ABC transport system permease protein